mgnify:CR=1 FL=1
MLPHEHTVVMKFGGSSLADTEKIRRVARLVADRHIQGENVVVVVSAQGKTTDQLMKMAHEVTSNPSKRELDMLLTVGERSSMALLSMAISELGHQAISLTGSQCGIITNDNHFNARIIDVKPWRILDELSRGHIVIVAGFQGISYRKEITTLGRGGSDTTAVALAAALDARWCEIYSDVDGVYTADPRVVDPFHLVELSHEEMMQMAYRGAKVLNLHAVEFARRRQITVYAKATVGGRETVVRRPPVELGRALLSVASYDRLLGIRTSNQKIPKLLEELAKTGVEIQYFLGLPSDHSVVILNPTTTVGWETATDGAEIIPLYSVSLIGRQLGSECTLISQAIHEAETLGAHIFCIETNPSHLTFYCYGEGSAPLVKAFHQRFIVPLHEIPQIPT